MTAEAIVFAGQHSMTLEPTSRENLPKAHDKPRREDGCRLDLECDDVTVEKAHWDASVMPPKALADRH